MLLYVTFTVFNFPQSPIQKKWKKIEYMLQEIQNEKEFQWKEKETLNFYNAYDIPETEKVDLFEED